MKVSIIGHGFVGKALDNSLNHDIEKLIIDPIYKNDVSDIADFIPEIIFICVPTPMKDDGGQDLDILNEVIKDIKKIKLDTQVVLKSTVLPNHILDIKNLFPSIVYNPEFLTEINAFEDFINADLIVLGGDNASTSEISSFYTNQTKCITDNHIITDLISASLIKYTINCFLASKVIFFNELHDVFKNSGTNETWENFVKAISLDTRMGKSHMQVPGPDGRYGFGGACFPKDSQALYEYSLLLKTPLQVLKKVMDINNEIRGSYENTKAREAKQNINFSSKD
tara:strand:- start:95 stop:940 length:846 start_codon:yes stop_codon:yes gene_type:complete